MFALKSAVLNNIQSHKRTIIDFPQVGIVRIYGNNSNGKSVLVKVLNDVVSNAITRPVYRRSIIRRGNEYGELLLSRYDGTTLYICISLEASNTYAELTRPNSQPVRRYLADKSIPLLVREFGWHYNSEHGISLNIHQDTDGFLFVDTKKSVNFDLLNSVRSDQFAEAAAESLEKLLKESKRQRAEIHHAFEVAQATYAALQYWDEAKETKCKDDCTYFARNIEALGISPIPEVRSVPKVVIFETFPAIPEIRYMKVYEPFTLQLPDISKSMLEVQELASGICPTCKRALVE